MNLMFWKKNTGSGVENTQGDSSVHEKTQQPLDPAATEQQATESNPEPPGQEAPIKTGLVARIKSGLASFAQRFKKTPAFKAEEPAPEAHDHSGTAPSAEEKQGGDTPQKSKDDPEDSEKGQAKPSLVTQIKSRFAAVIARFRKTPEPGAKEGQGGSPKETPKSAEEAPAESGRLADFFSAYKKYLILVLLLLLLGAGVYAAWDIIFPPLVRKPTPHVVRKPAVQEPASQVQETAPQDQEPASQAPEPAPQPQEAASQPQETAPPIDIKALNKSEEAQARAEALKKQSAEMQAQAETLRKESEAAQARADELKKKEADEKARVEALKKKSAAEKKARAEALKKSSRQQSLQPGEIAASSGDPKASAKALKEAIEAMNGGSGKNPKRSAK